MAKALKIGASIAAIAAVSIVTGGAALGLSFGTLLSTSVAGISAGGLLAASSVLGAGASLLAPKPKAPAGLSQSDRLNVSINVREPRKIVFGSTAMATDLRDQEWSGDQTYLHRFIVLASHKVSAVREIWFDDKLAWTATGGAQGEFAKWLVVTPVLEGNAANAINVGPRMGGARRFTGCAYVHIRYQILANSKKLDSVFNQSVPSRVTIVGDGAAVYDPRRDSTVPGGSGPQRANDQSTWEWNASASRNPALCTLFYLLGWRINGKLAVGKGIPPRRIDLASFIEAANLCDEPVAKSAGGTEPRYRCDGVISEADDTTTVLDNLKATMNAVLDDVDGRLRISVLHNDLAAPIGDLFTGDVLGAANWQQTLPLNDSVSVIRGGYTDPGSVSLYQTADYPEVTIASRDGIERSQTVNYPLVQSASQAQRLSKQRLQRMLYGGTFTAVFQSTAWKFQKGDVIRLTFAPLGWDRKLFRIADMATQVDGKVPMMLREEHSAIYAWDASDAAPVTGAEPTRYDPALFPLVQGITEAGTTADWDKVSGEAKPADNATVGAPSGTNVGDRPVDDVLAAIDAAKARQDQFDTVTIPAINKAVEEAGTRITAARGRADDAYGRADLAIQNADTVNRRVDQLIAEGSEGVDNVARAEIKRVDEAAISRDGAITRSIETFEASYESGAGNLLSNTDFPADDLAGWHAEAYLIPIEAFHRDLAGDLWQPIGESVLGIRQIGRVGDPNAYADAVSDFFAVESGTFIQFYHFAGSHRCNTQLWINYYDTNGGYVTSAGGTIAERRTGGRAPANWARNGRVCEQVPANAVTARLIMRKLDTDGGEYDSYAWFWRPYVGPARQGQTSWNPYSVGSGKAVARAIDARVTREVTTLAEKDAALARETVAVEARLSENIAAKARDVTTAFTDADRALTERAISLESSFRTGAHQAAEFDQSFPLDQYWASSHVLGATYTGSRAFLGTAYDNASCLVVSPGAEYAQFFSKATFPVDPSKRYRISCRLGAYRASAPFGPGSLVYVGVVCLDGAGNMLDHGGYSTYRYSCVVAERIENMGSMILRSQVMTGEGNDSWQKFAPGTKQVRLVILADEQRDSPLTTYFDYVRFEDAEGEQRAGDALARANEVFTVLSGSQSATAQRTSFLEAQMNRQTDSVMNDALVGVANSVNLAEDRVNARIETRATAIADAKVGAVVQDVSTLRGEYNGTKGEVSRQAGVIVDLQGKSSAYVKLVADAGNGRAALSLWSDQFGGAWSLTGNGLIDGNLTINGTLKARAFDRSSMSRDGRIDWTGNVSPGIGQTINLPGLGLPTIPPLGRFIYEVVVVVQTNAGTRTTTNMNGKPAYLDYLRDGGVLMRAVDNQGNAYTPRTNNLSDTVIAATDFTPNFAVTISRGSQDTGWVDQGDYYSRQMSGTYTVTSYSLRATWVAI